MSEFYDRTDDDFPSNYDTGLGPVIFAPYAADIARRAAAGAPSRVLETACGTGIVTRALLDTLPPRTPLVATDLNATLIGTAQQKCRPDETVVFRAADAAALPFADRSFDAVVCQFGVMFYPDKDKGYREALRVLVPGGRYLFSVWDSHRHNPWARLTHEITSGFLSPTLPRFTLAPFVYNAIDPIKESLLAAGFDDIEVAVLRFRQPVTDIASFARGMVFGSPLLDEILGHPGGDSSRLHETLTLAMRNEFGPVSCIVPMQAIVFTAVRPAS
jgi:SAM-dependent methyltransferase